MLKGQVIKSTNSLLNYPILILQKEDGHERSSMDYRDLEYLTEADRVFILYVE